MHFLLSSMSVVYVLTTPMPEDGGDNPTIDQNVETSKELWDTSEAKYMAVDASSILNTGDEHGMKPLRAQINDKPKGNILFGPISVNMVEHNNSSKYNDNKGKRKHHDTKADPNKKPKDDDVAWWVNSRATIHVCKDRCWFKTYESLNDGSILHIGNESTTLVHGCGYVDLRFTSGKVVFLLNVLHVPNITKNLVSSSVLNNCGYKKVIESYKFVLSKHGVFIGFGYLSNHMFTLNILFDNIGSAFMSTSKLNNSILWHARLCHVHKRFKTDMGGEYMDTLYFQYVSIIHETTAPYTPQQNGISKRKNRVLKEMVNSTLSYSGLSQGFWSKAMLIACYLLNRIPNKRNDSKF
ncbi:zinc finger, CCHC-type containing protein [Tanacetum coccineum]